MCSTFVFLKRESYRIRYRVGVLLLVDTVCIYDYLTNLFCNTLTMASEFWIRTNLFKIEFIRYRYSTSKIVCWKYSPFLTQSFMFDLVIKTESTLFFSPRSDCWNTNTNFSPLPVQFICDSSLSLALLFRSNHEKLNT